jgi:hypothetical protein
MSKTIALLALLIRRKEIGLLIKIYKPIEKIKNMKRIYQIVIVAVFAFSCKSELSKIDINQVELHRKYQDSILDLSKNPDSNFRSLKMLISEYKSLKIDNKEINENYLYLMGRLYSQLFSKRFPFKGIVFDTLTKQMKDSILYMNYYDSAIYYNEEALRVNPNHIRSMLNFSSTYFNEVYNYGIMKSEKINVPYSSIRDNQKFSDRFNYILNNSTKFYDIDTSKNKEVSKSIIIRTYETFTGYLDLEKLNYDNVNDLNIILRWNEFYTYSNKFKGLIFSKEHNEKTVKLINAYYRAKNRLDEIKMKEQKEAAEAERIQALNNIDLVHKYSSVDTDAGLSVMLDLWTSSDYTQVGTSTIRGRGTYSREGSIIHFISTSGISVSGDAKFELDKNNRIIITLLSTGARYIQDDNSDYIKKNISTK